MMLFKLLRPKLFTSDRFFTVITLVLSICLFSSCTATKNSYYFKTIPRDTTIITSVTKGPESKIKKNDLLAITISSLNPQEDIVYNAAGAGTGSTSLGSGATGGYPVDLNGNIQMHRLGVLHVEGMTRKELKDKLLKDISPYLKDPVISVNYLNHHITVFGSVGSVQLLPMPEEQVSILDVLASSGDLSAAGRRDNILIIRDSGNVKQFKRVNLEDHSIFTSPWYYLQAGDIVYVEPNDKKIKEEKSAKRQQTLSLVMTIVTFALLIVDRIFR
jgi:polysaccharide export outer membrane protein